MVLENSVIVNEVQENEQFLLQNKGGYYFGELLFINRQLRAARIKCVKEFKYFTLDRLSVDWLLGPMQESLIEKASKYKKLGFKKRSRFLYCQITFLS